MAKLGQLRLQEVSAKNVHVIGYAGMVTLTIYVILDLEYPRYGLIRLDFAQDALEDVRKSMR